MENINNNKLSLILCLIFIVVIMILVFVLNYSQTKVDSVVARYSATGGYDSEALAKLRVYEITDTSINYELILKNDKTFILHIKSVNSIAYLGTYDKGFFKITLHASKKYSEDSKCYNLEKQDFVLKRNGDSLTSEDINYKEITFNIKDYNLDIYEYIENSVTSCGKSINF